MEIRKCATCGRVIPRERIEALPETTTCVKCSQVQPVSGYMVWDKSTSSLVVTDASGRDHHNELEKSDGRLGRLK